MIAQLRDKLEGRPVKRIASLTLHLTERCNLACKHCSQTRRDRREEMSDEVFQAVVRQSPIYTCITGGGEPTFLRYPRRFADLLEMLPDRSVYMLCNGTRVPDNPERWVSKMDFIRISLDAGSAASFASLKGVDVYPAVRRNIRQLLKLGVNRVGVSYVVQRSTITELPGLLEELALFYYKYGYRFYVRLKPLRGRGSILPRDEQIDKLIRQVNMQRKRSILFERFIDDATDFQGVAKMVEPVSEQISFTEKCYYCLLYVLVTPNGDVFPCGLMNVRNENCLGNVLRHPWSRILVSQKSFFDRIKPRTDKACVGCWEISKNRILDEIIHTDVKVHPELTKIGGYSTLYCRY
jgi:radical SAM protein with 4Fe4S-binding SPASM domain